MLDPKEGTESSPPKLRFHTIMSHKNSRVDLVWLTHRDEQSDDIRDDIPPFAYQVYFTASAAKAAEDRLLPIELALAIGTMKEVTSPGAIESINEDTEQYTAPDYRLEIHARPCPNILACVSYNNSEMVHQGRPSRFPILVGSWARGDAWLRRGSAGYRRKFIVIDSDDWRTEGVLLIETEPTEYFRPRRTSEQLGTRDVSLVTATRTAIGSDLSFRLKSWWVCAGGQEAEVMMERAALARGDRQDVLSTDFSYPPRYYTVDDSDHDTDGSTSQEVSSDDVSSSNGEGSSGDVAENDSEAELEDTEVQNLDQESDIEDELGDEEESESDQDSHSSDPASEADDDDTGVVLARHIKKRLDKNELYRLDEELPHLQTEQYEDTLGHVVTSVWNSKRSKARPRFSFTLYLADDMLPLRARALFSCLDWGLISQVPWTLDLVRELPSLEDALDHHLADSTRRTEASTTRARCTASIVLDKVIGNRLPTELQDLITDMIVPPAIPDYSSRFSRPHRKFFMYLDTDHMSKGPLTVSCDPAPWQRENRYFASLGSSFRLANLRFWHRVSDELHILWSLCSPRSPLLSPSELPKITMTMHFTYRTPQEEAARGEPVSARLSLRSNFREPIVIPTLNAFSHDIWGESWEIVNLETGDITPDLPYLQFWRCDSTLYLDSWSRSRELGLGKSSHLQTLQPGTESWLSDGSKNLRPYLREREHLGSLKPGRRYAFRLKPGCFLQRWTLGTVEHVKGPFNLPPVPVEMEPAEFIYRGEQPLEAGQWRG